MQYPSTPMQPAAMLPGGRLLYGILHSMMPAAAVKMAGFSTYPHQ
jgi:hypothetical protein